MNNWSNIFSELNQNFLDIKSIKLLKDSLNSEIYSIIYKGEKSILKIYKSKDQIRIQREAKVLTFLNKKNFKKIPKIYESNLKRNFIIMSYLEGKNPNSDINFINKLSNYINEMQLYIGLEDKKNLPYAAEACLNLNEHFEKTIKKITDIRNKIKEFKYSYETLDIIEYKILPWIDNYKKDIQLKIKCKDNIDNKDLILSQSDIGIHNTFIFENELYTFDYEYAGLDDPAKTICDLIINPNTFLNTEEILISLNHLKKLKIFKNSYKKALIILPLYRYKWFAIIVNSFLKNINTNKSNASLFFNKANNYLNNTYTPINSILKNINLKI